MNINHIGNPETPRVTNNWKKNNEFGKASKHGSVTSGFWASCFPFTIAAVASTLVDSFVLVTDWFAYQELSRTNLTSYIPRGFKKTRDSGNNGEREGINYNPADASDHGFTAQGLKATQIESFYSSLPLALFALCITSAVVFGLHLAWCSYMMCRRRRMFLEKRDGVPYSPSFVEEFGGEILTLVQCVVEDIPISLLYLLLQISICCDMLFTLPHIIYVVSFAATTLSAAFKVIQVIWRSGCFGQRYEYNNKRSLQFLRLGTLFVAIAALVISSLNLSLLTSRKIPRKFLDTDVFDNVGIRNWIADDQIVIYHRGSAAPGESEESGSSEHKLPEYENSTSFVALKDIIDKESQVVTVIPACCQENQRLRVSHDNNDKNSNDIPNQSPAPTESSIMFNCSLIYQFKYTASELTIFYNFGYKCFDMSGSCVSYFPAKSNEAQTTPPLIVSALIVAPDVDGMNVDYGSSHVEMSDRYEEHWIKCSNVELVLNRTLLEFNPCSFSPLEQ